MLAAMQGPGYPYPPAYPAPPPKSGGFPTWAIVLIATIGILVLLVVVMGVLAVAGMKSYLTASKTAEATNSVGQISRSATDAYERESMSSGVLSLGAPAGITTHQLCGSAHPVPLTVPSAMKYQSSMSDWDGTPTEGWECLRYEMMSPQYYQYDYKATGTGRVGDSYTAIAKGDLDGDGDTSSFTLTGRVVAGDRIVADPTPTIVDAKE